MDYDMASNLRALPAITAGTQTTDQVSSALDTSLYNYKALTLAVYLGAGGITFTSSNKIDVNITHSDDDSTYVVVTDDDVILPYSTTATVALLGASDGTVKSVRAAHATEEVFLVGYRGKKRYVKVELDFVGTHGTGTLVGAEWILGNPMSAPYQPTAIPDMV